MMKIFHQRDLIISRKDLFKSLIWPFLWHYTRTYLSTLDSSLRIFDTSTVAISLSLIIQSICFFITTAKSDESNWNFKGKWFSRKNQFDSNEVISESGIKIRYLRKVVKQSGTILSLASGTSVQESKQHDNQDLCFT